MSYLNLNYGLISYKDPSPTNPQVRLGGDIAKSFQSIITQHANTRELTLSPGESRDVVTTLRPLGLDATSELSFERPFAEQDLIRIRWTGTGAAPNFRTKRALSVDATTEITVTRVAPNTVRFQRTGGTAMVTTAVQIGDILKLEKNTDAFTSPFNEVNLGKSFVVQSKGADYIDVIDNQAYSVDVSPITLGADFDFAFRVFSNGPVKVGDTLSVIGDDINQSNKGTFQVTDLSSDYVEIVNSYGVVETLVLGADNFIRLYDHLIGFLHLLGNSAFKVKVNDQEAFVVDRLTSSEALFIGSVKAYKVEVQNDSSDTICVDAQFAAVVK